VNYALPGKSVSRFAMRQDRTVFLLVFARRRPAVVEARDTSAQKAMLHEQFDDAGWECPQMINALDRCDSLYFDCVSQIRMPAWSRGRVALVGDAAFCPSLVSGQGAALAMVGSYVLAGELATSTGGVLQAVGNYQRKLDTFMAGKQEAARRFARAFAPRTRWGVLWRNQASKALWLPWIADVTFGRLLDRLDLAPYPAAPADLIGRSKVQSG
jgi:2-polyprenyl-6-methoxyphenol hydroxylase-like FAD-dependent oxidoreductase